MKNRQPYFIAILLATTLLAICSYLWTTFATNKEQPPANEIIPNSSFNNEHYNLIYLDTFIHLLEQAYGNSISTHLQTNELQVTLKNAGIVAKDFYNGNDNILKQQYDDFGFEITYQENSNTLLAKFKIDKGAVPVPNDVLIKLIDKNYNK